MLVEKIARRTLRWLVRRGALTEEGHLAGIEEGDEDGGEVLQQYRAAAIQGKIAIGKQAGLQAERLWDPFWAEVAGAQALRGSRKSSRCADCEGFSLHANVWVGAHRRDRLERLVRYVARLRLPRIPSGRSGSRNVALHEMGHALGLANAGLTRRQGIAPTWSLGG